MRIARRGTTVAGLWLLPLKAAYAAPDTLVVCPAAFRSAVVEWDAYRRSQGHELAYISPPPTAEALKAAIRQAGRSGTLKFVVLIGDEPNSWAGVGTGRRVPASGRSGSLVPTDYVVAKVNVRWGSETKIATDLPFADLDDDGSPDVAIGRIPADSPDELAVILQKTLRYEQRSEPGSWQRRLSFTSGQGGFGAVTDALIEAAARQIILQNVPAEFETQHICPTAGDAASRIAASFAARARNQLSAGSLAWVYMGHGLPTELDHVRTPTGSESILSVGDVPKLKCSGHSPLAVLVACYTGAMDGPRDCLAEELLKAEGGPVAVLAASRVTMPYGNTVLGCELLRACFRDRPEHLGDTLRIAQGKTLRPNGEDQLRTSLDSIAAGISPPPVDLRAERQEHVLMYHLIGDPLLHLRYPIKTEPALDSGGSIGE